MKIKVFLRLGVQQRRGSIFYKIYHQICVVGCIMCIAFPKYTMLAFFPNFDRSYFEKYALNAKTVQSVFSHLIKVQYTPI